MKKILFLTLSILILTNVLSAQEATYQLSSHILDITQGKPASNVKISLSKQDKKGNWNIIDEKYTDENGRIKNFLKEEKGTDHKGIYKLTFFTEPYFKDESGKLLSFYRCSF